MGKKEKKPAISPKEKRELLGFLLEQYARAKQKQAETAEQCERLERLIETVEKVGRKE